MRLSSSSFDEMATRRNSYCCQCEVFKVFNSKCLSLCREGINDENIKIADDMKWGPFIPEDSHFDLM